MKDAGLNFADEVLYGAVHLIVENTWYTLLLLLDNFWLLVTGRGDEIPGDEIEEYLLRFVVTVVAAIGGFFFLSYLPWWSFFLAGLFTLAWETYVNEAISWLESWIFFNFPVKKEVKIVEKGELLESAVVAVILTAVAKGIVLSCMAK